MRFIWIDDNDDRSKDAKLLANRLKIEVQFVPLNERYIDDVLDDIAKQPEPDLVLLDHSLDQGKSKTIRTGSTAASFLHETWPKCPIISFTGVPIESLDIRNKDAYDDIFAINHVTKKQGLLLSIANGTKLIRDKNIENSKQLMTLIGPSEDDVDKITKILPSHIKFDFKDNGYVLEVYKWMKDVLFTRPGFLYDDLWAATLVGMNNEGWSEYKGHFTEAKYNGIFADPQRPLWWRSKIIYILNEKSSEINASWVIGRTIAKKEKFHSKCHFSEEDYPETVAAVDDSVNAEWYPMKLKYTDIHPGFENLLFMDEMRVMK